MRRGYFLPRSIYATPTFLFRLILLLLLLLLLRPCVTSLGPAHGGSIFSISIDKETLWGIKPVLLPTVRLRVVYASPISLAYSAVLSAVL
jgi:hypothetical protein